jgi:hypothetical protein
LEDTKREFQKQLQDTKREFQKQLQSRDEELEDRKKESEDRRKNLEDTEKQLQARDQQLRDLELYAVDWSGLTLPVDYTTAEYAGCAAGIFGPTEQGWTMEVGANDAMPQDLGRDFHTVW